MLFLYISVKLFVETLNSHIYNIFGLKFYSWYSWSNFNRTTPILQTEHIRGLEEHVNFIQSGATDIVRVDPAYAFNLENLVTVSL